MNFNNIITFSSSFSRVFTSKRFAPAKRCHDGWRSMASFPDISDFLAYAEVKNTSKLLEALNLCPSIINSTNAVSIGLLFCH